MCLHYKESCVILYIDEAFDQPFLYLENLKKFDAKLREKNC